ncbi:MAG TPA: helix-turn-helix domain-containing protein [Lysobacter sp.]
MNKMTVNEPTCEECVHELNVEIREAISTFNGKWKLEILWLLSQRVHRFNEMRRELPNVTQHTLTQQLRELERDGMVLRTAYPEIPPRVEYEITAKAKGLKPVFAAVFTWVRESSQPQAVLPTQPDPSNLTTSESDVARQELQ